MARIRQIMICPNQLSKHARANIVYVFTFSCFKILSLVRAFLDEIIWAFYLFFPGLQKPSHITILPLLQNNIYAEYRLCVRCDSFRRVTGTCHAECKLVLQHDQSV